MRTLLFIAILGLTTYAAGATLLQAKDAARALREHHQRLEAVDRDPCGDLEPTYGTDC